MLYWFFVKGLGPIAIHRLGPTAQGLENIPHEGGAIIAANHLAVIDDALLPLTCPRMIHFMGKAEYFEGKGIKGKFKKWWFTSVGVFPVDRSGGSKSLGALNHAREIIELTDICSAFTSKVLAAPMDVFTKDIPARRVWHSKPVAPLFRPPSSVRVNCRGLVTGHLNKGKSKVIYGKPIEVEKKSADQITHDDLRSLTDRVTREIQKMSGQEYVDEYAQKVKAELKAQQEAEAQAQAESGCQEARFQRGSFNHQCLFRKNVFGTDTPDFYFVIRIISRTATNTFSR